MNLTIRVMYRENDDSYIAALDSDLKLTVFGYGQSKKEAIGDLMFLWQTRTGISIVDEAKRRLK